MIKIKRARDLLQTEFLRCYSPVPYFGGDEGRSERDVLFFVSRKGMFFTRGDGEQRRSGRESGGRLTLFTSFHRLGGRDYMTSA